MNVLITGSSGFLGNTLIEKIKQEDKTWNLIGVDIKSKDNQGINFLKYDLSKKVSWKRIIEENNINLIYHIAGVFLNIDNYTMMKINVLQLLSFFEEIRKTSLNPIIVIIGSAAQYGLIDKQNLPVEENTIQKPISFYGLTKKWQEEMAIHYFMSYGIKTICTRPSNLIGKGIAETLLPGFLTKSFTKNDDLINIEISSKNDKRDYIDVRDVASALILLAKNNKSVGEVFNISSSELISNEQLVHLFAKNSNKKVNIKEKFKASNSEISLLNKKISSYLNWERQYGIEDSIKWCLGID